MTPEHEAIRQQAITNKEATYSTGEPCSANHNSPRYTRSSTCVQCLDENSDYRRVKIETRRKSRSESMRLRKQQTDAKTELMLLDKIAKAQFAIIKIKRHRRLSINEAHKRKKLLKHIKDGIYYGPVNNRVATFE